MIALLLLLAAQPVRIGLVRSPDAAPLYVAIEENFFAQAGLEPEVRFFPSDEAVVKAMVAGKLDVGFAALDAAWYRAAATDGLKMIGSQVFDWAGFPLYAIAGHGLKGPKDLAGKRVGLRGAESGVRYALQRLTDRFRLEPQPRAVIADDPVRALRAGKVDAALVPLAEARRSKLPVLRLGDLVQWQHSAIFVKDAGRAAPFLTAYRRGAAEYNASFLQYDDGGDFIPGSRHALELAAIARQAGMKPKEFEAVKPYSDPRAGVDVADIAAQVTFWQALGKLDPRVTAKDLIGAPP
jgi:NitT/TauT family transport system substrate-binding protein